MDQDHGSDRYGLKYKYDALCKTDIMESTKYTFVWRISEFISRPEKNGEVLISEEFTTQISDDKSIRWRVELYPRGVSINPNYIFNGSDVSLFLRKQTVDAEIEATYVLSSLDAKGVKQKIKSFEYNHTVFVRFNTVFVYIGEPE